MPVDGGANIPTPAIAMEQPISSTYDVNIRKVANGFIVVIGCKTFVFSTWKEISTGLALYWRNPNAAREKYCKDDTVSLRRRSRELSRNRRREVRSRRANRV